VSKYNYGRPSKRGVGGYAREQVTIRRDPRIDDSGNYHSGPKEHAKQIEGASKRTRDTISTAGMADGLSAPVSMSGNALTRGVARKPPIKTY
jgi:hypothetical protein